MQCVNWKIKKSHTFACAAICIFFTNVQSIACKPIQLSRNISVAHNAIHICTHMEMIRMPIDIRKTKKAKCIKLET